QQEWPGNVRELRNFIEKVIVTTESKEIDLEIVEDIINGESSKKDKQDMTLNEYLESVEKEFIVQLFKKYPSSIKLSKKLGISQSTANRKIQKYINGL
ncbi:TyrR/PhhR family helix-turn-helix DNA-binding protein, partial [Peribacillus butanolivorans]